MESLQKAGSLNGIIIKILTKNVSVPLLAVILYRAYTVDATLYGLKIYATAVTQIQCTCM
jgi:hypothetical protein